MRLLITANSNQATAIGTGLGQVALIAVKTDRVYANQIQEQFTSAIKEHTRQKINRSRNKTTGKKVRGFFVRQRRETSLTRAL